MRRAYIIIKIPTLWRVWWFIAYRSGFYRRWNRYKDSIGIAHDHDVYRHWLKNLWRKLRG